MGSSKAIIQLYAILEAVADRIEMHNNVGEQRVNWNTLLLNSINMLTLAASTMASVAEIAIGNPSEGDVRDAIEKVLALDKAYPLPLLGGAMLEKFPAKFEAARWWPKSRLSSNDKDKIMEIKNNNNNGWNVELEEEMREVIEVLKRKDMEDYERLGNIALKINKGFAVSTPFPSGIAALGSVFSGDGLVPAFAGALATVVNAFEHGGQVGMVLEMYRTCGGFFQLLEETIEATIEEKDLDKRENGELFEMKMALQLGRSVSQLRELTTKSASCHIEGREIHEFASKLS
uniref:F-box protein n=1 Tax=Glycine max TaxID=3847 RepID=A0A0R0J3Z0_SOYBN